ncbi:MAG: CotH kinase family protein, partial [Planctomycetota bacterium]|nr:CotH kinase family protein [Planctomycetota bacterium]
KYPTVDPAKVVCGWTGQLGNNGQDLELENDAGQRIDFVSYADEGDWAVRQQTPKLAVTRLVSSGTTATATVAAGHGFVNGDYIRIAGAAYANYNGPFVISNVTATTFTYTISAATTSPDTSLTITAQLTDLGFAGWEWSGATDGGGKSLELINALFTNESGQNWAASIPTNGTPGAVNSVAASDIAPLILDVKHLPAIPRSIDPVTVTASILDELGTSATVKLYWRLDGATTFTASTMLDDGAHGDGLAGDGVYGAVIPAQGDKAIVEFYLQAQDPGGKTRTWPAPTQGGYGQAANLLYQVDNTFDPNAVWVAGSAPLYRIILTAAEQTYLLALLNSSAPMGDSDAQMNGTLITLDGTGLDVEYRVGIRNRGNGSRYGTPHNYHINIPHDQLWNGVTALNVNARTTYSQVLGSEVFHAAGIGGPTETAVQFRVNGTNYATGSGMEGFYASKETFDSELAAHWFPDDPNGDLYQCFYDDSVSPRIEAKLIYEGSNPDTYRSRYFKKTNTSFDDWTGLVNMMYVFANAPAGTFEADISGVINVDQWLRFIAVDSMLGNQEGGLCTGVGDDY